MKKRIVIGIGLLLVCCCPLWAQFDAQVSNYWAIPSYFNPGRTAVSGNMEVTGLYRLQWLGVEHAPKTGIMTAEMPLKLLGQEFGVGLSMYDDQIGLFKSSLMSGQIAKKFKFAKGNLSIGLRGGMIDESFDGTGVEIPDDDFYDPNDEAIPRTKVSGSSIDAAFGVFYEKEKWYAGLSATHLLAPKLELDEKTTLEIPRTYYFTAGYNLTLSNPLIELKPSILVKTIEMSTQKVLADSLQEAGKPNALKGLWKQTQIDVSLRLVYNKTFWGGVSWRRDDALTLLLGGKFKVVEVGYAYDYPISDIIKVSSGSHELFIKYTVDLNKTKPQKGKYKSVRLL
ncbi:MAG: type IX secretion system membrane protein PorP/SprF [Candidatus Symbiothrix sp.]|nr:type IX secretion system membrane protein PorP/SprF [Candidatus Symbiothrix sp.]